MANNVSLERNNKLKKLQYCVYILLSLKDKQFYIGYTSNLKRRLTEHFHGDSKATKYRLPVQLIFCEYYLFKEDAMKREQYFKTTMGKKALKIMLSSTILKFKQL